MIIFGHKTTASITASGVFFCPRCRTSQGYYRYLHRRWFTLYFLPVLPLGHVGEEVECQGCFSRFLPDGLTGPPNQDVVMAALVDGPAIGESPTTRQLPQAPRTSSLAISSLVLGILSLIGLCVCGISLLTSPAAIATGHLALARIRRSAGRLAGQGYAMTGLVCGYVFLLASIAAWTLVAPSFVRGWRAAHERAAGPQSLTRATAEQQLQSAEMRVLTPGPKTAAAGNSPAATELAKQYAQALQAMRAEDFTADRDRVFSLTDGRFVVWCELHSDRCLFLVHVPSYRDFAQEAKRELESRAWELAQGTVQGTLQPDDQLAVGLRGVALYGAILVGPASGNAAESPNYTRSERRELLAFFSGPDADGEVAWGELAVPGVSVTGNVERDGFGSGESHDAPASAAPPSHVDLPRPSFHPPASQDPESVATAPKAGHLAEIVQRVPNMGWTVQSLAFAANGRFLAAGKLDATVVVLDATTGQSLHSEARRNDIGQIQGLAFTHDGRRLIAGGHRGVIQIWDVDAAGRLQAIGSVAAHARPVTSLATSAETSLVISGSAAGELAWQDCQPSMPNLRRLAVFQRAVLNVCLSGQGDQAWATDGRRLVQINLREASVIRDQELGHGLGQAAAFSRDGKQLAICQGTNIRIWDTLTGSSIRTLTAERDPQWSLEFLPHGPGLISGGRGTATLWSLANGEAIAQIDAGGIQYIKALAVTPDASLLAVIPSAAGQTLTIARLPTLP
jgi:hypothetical protein